MQSLTAPVKSTRLQFGLSTLFAIVTLVSAELALLVNCPEIGLPVGVFIVPALARTWAVAAMRRELRMPVEYLRIFFVSLGLIWLLFVLGVGLIFLSLIFSAVAFELSQEVGLLAFFMGAAIAALVPVGLFIKLWPRRIGQEWVDDSPWT